MRHSSDNDKLQQVEVTGVGRHGLLLRWKWDTQFAGLLRSGITHGVEGANIYEVHVGDAKK